MNQLHGGWLELMILTPLVGAAWVRRLRDPEFARRWSLGFHGATLVLAIAAWIDIECLGVPRAAGPWLPRPAWADDPLLQLDTFNAPLLVLAALLYCLTSLTTVRTKIRRFSFAWTLLSEALVLALYSVPAPWPVVVLLALGTLPPYFELRSRKRSARVYAVHMALFVGLLVAGQALLDLAVVPPAGDPWAVGLLLLAVCLRSGLVPFHCWITDLFERATFGTAMVSLGAMPGAYAAVRLLLPVAGPRALQALGTLAAFTAVYAAGMSLVQREARRFFAFLFLSHSALVLIGLQTGTVLGLTGTLSVWLSVVLALGGLGLTLRAMEARTGRLTLTGFHGLYEQTPTLAACFLLTGLAAVGFPGTFGFVGTELLIDALLQQGPYAGVAVVCAAGISGIAILRAWFAVYAGRRHASAIDLRGRTREKCAVLVLAALILAGGLVPQPGITSRLRAAAILLGEYAAPQAGQQAGVETAGLRPPEQ